MRAVTMIGTGPQVWSWPARPPARPRPRSPSTVGRVALGKRGAARRGRRPLSRPSPGGPGRGRTAPRHGAEPARRGQRSRPRPGRDANPWAGREGGRPGRREAVEPTSNRRGREVHDRPDVVRPVRPSDPRARFWPVDPFRAGAGDRATAAGASPLGVGADARATRSDTSMSRAVAMARVCSAKSRRVSSTLPFRRSACRIVTSPISGQATATRSTASPISQLS